MILVDTSVWIDFFANNQKPHVLTLIEIIEKKIDICLCGVILTEILQGLKNEKEYLKIQESFESFVFLNMSKSTFILAANIFRDLRKRGITIRKTIDCVIAATSIEHNIVLLHNDRDFEPIEKYCGLNVQH